VLFAPCVGHTRELRKMVEQTEILIGGADSGEPKGTQEIWGSFQIPQGTRISLQCGIFEGNGHF